MWCCSYDPMFGRLSRTPTCDGQTQTHGHSIYRGCIASSGKNQYTLQNADARSPNNSACDFRRVFLVSRCYFHFSINRLHQCSHKKIFYIVTVTQDITLTSRVDLDNVTVNQHGKYLGQSLDHFVKKTRSRRHRGDVIKLYKIIKGI